jgi:hypothetical protein
MPIPNTNTRITDQSLYPDRVEVSIGYRVPEMGSWRDFLERMTRAGWTRVPGKPLLRASLPHEAFPLPVGVTVSYNPHRHLLTFIVTLNALSDFHARRTDYDEVGYPAGRTNWLHRNTNINNICAQLCHHLEDRVNATVLDIPCLPVFEDVTLYLRSVNLHAIELCVDLATPNGALFIRRVTRRFLHRFNRVDQRFYGAAQGSLEVHSDNTLVRGFGVAGQHCKLYRKTDRRVRFEVTLGKHALQGMLGTRSLMRESGPVYSDPFDFDPREREYNILYYVPTLASEVFPDIEYILARERVRPSENSRLTEFRTRLALIIRDAATIDRVHQSLIVERRVTASSGILDAHTLGRLVNEDIFERSARGIYIEAPQYRRAVRELRAREAVWEQTMARRSDRRGTARPPTQSQPTPTPQRVIRAANVRCLPPGLWRPISLQR